MLEVYFLRHGESEGVKNNRLQGHLDLPLTDAGREQIHSLALYWQANQLTFKRIITSPLKRARESCDIVADILGISDINEESLWMERGFGKGEGEDLQVIARWYQSRPTPTVFEPIYDSGESEWQVHLRAGKAVEDLMVLPDGAYLVVSHGNVINAALHMIFGIMPQGRGMPIELSLNPGGYARLRYNSIAGRWSLLSFNGH